MHARSLLAKATFALLLVGALRASTAAAAPENNEIDPRHSGVLFRVQHFKAGYVYGRFRELSGTFVLDEADPSACKVSLTVKAASVDTNEPQRDDHLRSPDFFDVAQFPVITFESTGVAKAGDGYDVTGDLTLHGVKKSVTAHMAKTGANKDPYGMFRTGFEGTLTIRRSEFGMKTMLEGVSDEVRVILAFEGVRK